MPKIPGWAYSRAKNICLENRPIPPLKMTHICMFKMRFITFRTVFKQELFFFWCGDLENFWHFLISWYRDFLTIFLGCGIRSSILQSSSFYSNRWVHTYKKTGPPLLVKNNCSPLLVLCYCWKTSSSFPTVGFTHTQIVKKDWAPFTGEK